MTFDPVADLLNVQRMLSRKGTSGRVKSIPLRDCEKITQLVEKLQFDRSQWIHYIAFVCSTRPFFEIIKRGLFRFVALESTTNLWMLRPNNWEQCVAKELSVVCGELLYGECAIPQPTIVDDELYFRTRELYRKLADEDRRHVVCAIYVMAYDDNGLYCPTCKYNTECKQRSLNVKCAEKFAQ